MFPGLVPFEHSEHLRTWQTKVLIDMKHNETTTSTSAATIKSLNFKIDPENKHTCTLSRVVAHHLLVISVHLVDCVS
jgi:hypothetical protein